MILKIILTDIYFNYFNLWTRQEVHRAQAHTHLHNTDW